MTARKQAPEAQRLGQIQRDEVAREADHERHRPQRQPLEHHRHVARRTPSCTANAAIITAVSARRIAPVTSARSAPTSPAATAAGRASRQNLERVAGAQHERGRQPPKPTLARDHPPDGASSSPDSLRQLVEADDDAEQQPAEEKPGRRAAPGVQRVADAAEQHDGADQRVAGARGRSRPPDVLLQGTSGNARGRDRGRLSGHRKRPIIACPTPPLSIAYLVKNFTS